MHRDCERDARGGPRRRLRRLTLWVPLLLLAACSSTPAVAPTPAVFTAPTQTRVAQVAQAASPAAVAPSGWQLYRGTRVPFLVAYPPDWVADPANAVVGEIRFAPAQNPAWLSATIRTLPPSSPSATLSLLRDRLIDQSLRVCEGTKTVEGKEEEEVAGQAFATAIIRCGGEEGGEEDAALLYYLGAARVGDAEWDFICRSTADQFPASREQIFTPMLNTLTLYAEP